MPRPKIPRRIFFQPQTNYFKPVGIPLRNLTETILTNEELESIRLIDYENTPQIKACKKMKISQPTLSRLLTSARKKIAQALINGQAIKIQGGNFQMAQPKYRGRMGKNALGPSGNCICPKCKTKALHQIGQPCYQIKCPKCNSQMTRE